MLHRYFVHGGHRAKKGRHRAKQLPVRLITLSILFMMFTFTTAESSYGKSTEVITEIELSNRVPYESMLELHEREVLMEYRASRSVRRTVIEPVKSVQAPQVRPPDWVRPLKNFSTTSCYGMRWGRMHNGIDLAAPTGTTIKSVGEGTVTRAGWNNDGYGYSVMVDHGKYSSFYGHASAVHVSAGQSVDAGDKIASVGSTGFSTGPHLHINIGNSSDPWNTWTNPQPWFSERGIDLGC